METQSPERLDLNPPSDIRQIRLYAYMALMVLNSAITTVLLKL
jgi:hypothetical protein